MLKAVPFKFTVQLTTVNCLFLLPLLLMLVVVVVIKIRMMMVKKCDTVEWLFEAYRSQWLAMLKVDNGTDLGSVACQLL